MKKHAHGYMPPLRRSTVIAVLSKPLYDDMPDQMRHWQYIRSLADEMHQPVPVVKLLYENTLMHLKLNAKVQNFLPIFISKRLKRRTVFLEQLTPEPAISPNHFFFQAKEFFHERIQE